MIESRRGGLGSLLLFASVCGLAAHAAEAFSPAVYVVDGLSNPRPRIVVFPSATRPFSISLPLTIESVVYGPRGSSLYGTGQPTAKSGSVTITLGHSQRTIPLRPGLVKIDLDPVHITALPGFDAFEGVDSFAISRTEDKVLFAGTLRKASGRTCGVYEITLRGASLRPVMETSSCSMGPPWQVLGLSPVGEKALILDARRLAALDLTSGTVTPLGDDLWGGSWSPDGEWIAALKLGLPRIPSKTILSDPRDFSNRRDLGGLNDDEAQWSPDSRFLLHCIARPACHNNNPLALEMLDVVTGERSTIKDSVCNIGVSRQIGWVRSDIGR